MLAKENKYVKALYGFEILEGSRRSEPDMNSVAAAVISWHRREATVWKYKKDSGAPPRVCTGLGTSISRLWSAGGDSLVTHSSPVLILFLFHHHRTWRRSVGV